MKTCKLQELESLKGLVCQAQSSDEPVIVFDGEDECLVAMRPPVFERMLFGSDLLLCEDRASLHF